MTNETTNEKFIDDVYGSEQELVHGISHDMGAPIRSVVQFSQLLQNRLGERLDEKETYWLRLINESGLKVQKMIDAMLVYSRLSSQRNRDENFNLKSALVMGIDCNRKTILNTTPKIDIPHEMPDIIGCKEHWVVLFSYLIENALLYQPKDEEHQVILQINCDADEELVITIEDNGIGVPEEQWTRLTMPYKRMQAEENYPGIGMGLACCNRIARQHQGKLVFSASTLGGLEVKYIGPFIQK